ncbi:LacI family DNA-binding transcriptional regulator [Fulvivirga sediminis]|uniref:LacI family DNA-binding transcriptional regulator n=1 Tax=Fulvivirga sediminis TaxID=2803949 RepID=A0A937F935_9BACT|nr:LacI family DNA-binding transcriptional regulator [Fulvivirga sediminis]MBL3656223.1 LacI family DNA-binding transcriptional regulator [Fulvivirga sediminis]
MKNKKGVTIYDIAQELKVSPSTVSRALKDHFSISKEMIKEVKKVAQKRGYRPNSIAASLRNNRTNNIGVIISWINRPFVSSLISGIEEEANKAGYNVIISQSHDSFDNEVANARALYDSRISGLVVSLAMETQSYDHFNPFIQNNIPVVFVDRVADEFNSDKVVIDNFAAAYMATEHLIEQGCQRIALACGSQYRNIYRERESGYLAALREYNIPIKDEYIVHSDSLNAQEGFRIAEYFLSMETPPDAIFSVNDTAAVSFIQYAKEKGIKIPEELAVIGFNNDPVSLIIDPQLSTVSHPAIEMGKLAAQQVLKQSQYKDVVKSEAIMLRTELLVRASTKRK